MSIVKSGPRLTGRTIGSQTRTVEPEHNARDAVPNETSAEFRTIAR